MKKKVPNFKTDKEAEDFVDTADLSRYDLSGETVRYEFERKDGRLTMRLPAALLSAVRSKAEARGIPYQRFIREALEKATGAQVIQVPRPRVQSGQ